MAEAVFQNPLTAGLSKTLIPQPCSLVIFGGGGDLTRRKLIPAVYNLALDGVLPATFAVLGFSRLEFDDLGFRSIAADPVLPRRLLRRRGGLHSAQGAPGKDQGGARHPGQPDLLPGHPTQLD